LDTCLSEKLTQYRVRDQIRECRTQLDLANNSKKKIKFKISNMKGLYKNKLIKFKYKEEVISLENSLEIQDFKGFR